MSPADCVRWEVPQAPVIAGSVGERQRAVRRTDWRFLLPTADGSAFEHLVLLGEEPGLAEEVLEMRIARRVSTSLPTDRSADCVVRLHNSRTGLIAAAGCLRPGGLLYAEFDRHLAHARSTTPARARRELRAAGLEPLGMYWVRKSFHDHNVYIPAELSSAVTWYFSHLHHSYSRSWRERSVTACYRLAAAVGPAAIERVMRCYVVTATLGDAGGRTPSILEAPGLPDKLRSRTLRPIVIAPRLRRVTFLPFAPRERRPAVVLKVSRFPQGNPRTLNEQRTLTELAARLDERQRQTIPTPLGAYCWGELLVGVESCVEGRVLAHPRHPWTRVATRTHVKHLRAVADWLCEFHRHTVVRRQSWDTLAISKLESTFDQYELAFGLTADERRLFAYTRSAAQSLQGMPLPIVWRHCDLNPKNTYQTPRGISVVDWEDGKEGYPLLDLLFFSEEWLHHFPATPPDLAGKVSRFHDVFVQADENDLATREIHSAIHKYMACVGLAPSFYPVLHVLLWAEAAVRRFQDADDLDQDEIARAFVARHVGSVRALARGAWQLVEGGWPASGRAFDA